MDTGSADNTVELAKKWGCKVKEVGSKFVHTINEQEAKDINKRFIVDNEDPLLST